MDNYAAQSRDNDRCSMSKKYFKIAVPTVATCSLNNFVIFVTVVFAGRLDDPSKLAGVGLGITIGQILCFSIMTGLNGALDTLVSQTYGFGELRLCASIFNRGLIILTLVFIPLAILLCFIEPLMLKLGQDP